MRASSHASMKSAGTWKKLVLAVLVLLSLRVLWSSGWAVDGTEFSGGRVTGRLLDLCDMGMLALIPALIAVYWFPKVSASIALLAGLSCLPLLLYFMLQDRFRMVLKGEWSVPLQSNFVWARWTVLPVMTITATMIFALFVLFTHRSKSAIDRFTRDRFTECPAVADAFRPCATVHPPRSGEHRRAHRPQRPIFLSRPVSTQIPCNYLISRQK